MTLAVNDVTPDLDDVPLDLDTINTTLNAARFVGVIPVTSACSLTQRRTLSQALSSRNGAEWSLLEGEYLLPTQKMLRDLLKQQETLAGRLAYILHDIYASSSENVTPLPTRVERIAGQIDAQSALADLVSNSLGYLTQNDRRSPTHLSPSTPSRLELFHPRYFAGLDTFIGVATCHRKIIQDHLDLEKPLNRFDPQKRPLIVSALNGALATRYYAMAAEAVWADDPHSMAFLNYTYKLTVFNYNPQRLSAPVVYSRSGNWGHCDMSPPYGLEDLVAGIVRRNSHEVIRGLRDMQYTPG